MNDIDPFFLRTDLISSLQAEERESQWHYTQLELISQKIRNIPLTSAQSVSTLSTAHFVSPVTSCFKWSNRVHLKNIVDFRASVL